MRKIFRRVPSGYAIRLLLTGAGLLLALPERVTTVIGLVVAVVVYGGAALLCRRRWPSLVQPEAPVQPRN